ncbi:MAG: hypothetical protein VX223_11805, partial [Myxococcota bacterium]|nr:hypothetical protein [Myxococcota bacterium]
MKYTECVAHTLVSLTLAGVLLMASGCQDNNENGTELTPGADTVSALDTNTTSDAAPLLDVAESDVMPDGTTTEDTVEPEDDSTTEPVDTGTTDVIAPVPDSGPVEPPPGALKVTTV